MKARLSPDEDIPRAIGMSRVLEGGGHAPEARQLVEQALARLGPDNPWLLYRLAEISFGHGSHEAALRALQAIAPVPAGLARQRDRTLAATYLQLGQPDGGWPHVERAALGELSQDDALRVFFRRTFATRIRTNSLVSEYFANDYADAGAAARIGDLVVAARQARRPFSLVRLGDGEGRVLGGRAPTLLGATAWKTGEAALADAELADVAAALREACDGADVLGLPREDMGSEDYRDAIRQLDPATLGKLERGEIVLTDCHCHHALHEAGQLRRMLAGADVVGYVGGRDIGRVVGGLAPGAELIWHRVPVQRGQGELFDRPHYPDFHRALFDALVVPYRGAVFLVAAGVLGKIHAHWIKQRGGIAIDIGAVADIWSGNASTRAYMRRNGFAPAGG